MLDGRHDPALALLLTDPGAGTPDASGARLVLSLAGTVSLVALLVFAGFLIA